MLRPWVSMPIVFAPLFVLAALLASRRVAYITGSGHCTGGSGLAEGTSTSFYPHNGGQSRVWRELWQPELGLGSRQGLLSSSTYGRIEHSSIHRHSPTAVWTLSRRSKVIARGPIACSGCSPAGVPRLASAFSSFSGAADLGRAWEWKLEEGENHVNATPVFPRIVVCPSIPS
jgi:hypothetical protein